MAAAPEECVAARPTDIGNGKSVHVRSRAGIETCCYIEGMDIAFDIGVMFGKVKQKSQVLISHGHIDHIAALPKHAARRKLHNLPTATYYIPASIEPRVHALMDAQNELQEDRIPYNLVAVQPGETYLLNNRKSGRLTMVPFQTCHRVDSVGYTLYSNSHTLKRRYRGKKGHELAELRHQGVKVYRDTEFAEVAYTGDTTIDVFEENPHLFSVRVLIVEMTFVNHKVSIERATKTGHIHMDQFLPIAHKFTCEKIILMHISSRFTYQDVRAALADCPPDILEKITIAV